MTAHEAIKGQAFDFDEGTYIEVAESADGGFCAGCAFEHAQFEKCLGARRAAAAVFGSNCAMREKIYVEAE